MSRRAQYPKLSKPARKWILATKLKRFHDCWERNFRIYDALANGLALDVAADVWGMSEHGIYMISRRIKDLIARFEE